MPHVSRTVNPLHFEDLEPHRFEDLVRQLVYDFKTWHSIEATGRSGSDEGFDIRAWENVQPEREPEEDEEEEASHVIVKARPRLWLIQCKRERTITPRKIAKYAKDIFVSPKQPIYGVILAAPCDFSKRARDTFRDNNREKGIQEIHIWGRAELEDMLFQPTNDHLLFAYFGFSLRLRRRSLKTEIGTRLSIKRKLIRHLGPVNRTSRTDVLIRDAHNKNYPYKEDVKDFDKNPRWWPYTFIGHYHDGIRILYRKFFAYLTEDGIVWDYVKNIDMAVCQQNPWGNKKDSMKKNELQGRVWTYWSNIPKESRAWFEIITWIPYERIVALDENGDDCFPHPHIYVEPRTGGDFFEKGCQVIIGTDEMGFARREVYSPDPKNRVTYFPNTFPELNPPSKTDSENI